LQNDEGEINSIDGATRLGVALQHESEVFAQIFYQVHVASGRKCRPRATNDGAVNIRVSRDVVPDLRHLQVSLLVAGIGGADAVKYDFRALGAGCSNGHIANRASS